MFRRLCAVQLERTHSLEMMVPVYRGRAGANLTGGNRQDTFVQWDTGIIEATADTITDLYMKRSYRFNSHF